jgi:hypothetical protein
MHQRLGLGCLLSVSRLESLFLTTYFFSPPSSPKKPQPKKTAILEFSCATPRFFLYMHLIYPFLYLQLPFSFENCSHATCYYYSHLYDSSDRETFEFAHSVVLAVFASYAQRHQQQFLTGNQNPGVPRSSGKAWKNSGSCMKPKYLDNNDQHSTRALSGVPETRSRNGQAISETEPDSIDESTVSAKFMERMVPFYAKCLIEVGISFLSPPKFLYILRSVNKFTELL